MTLGTLARYLIGNRTAILLLVRQRGALLVGALFVLSAGFAREYDGESLIDEPWHLLLPFAASLVTSFVMFLLLAWAAWGRMQPPMPFWRGYWGFLTLYWLTAPLAWLYAIPYERFLDPVDAVAANLWTLAIVAAWRVALMIRVISVLTSCSLRAAFALVMFAAVVFTFGAMASVPMPLITIMGGIRLSPADQAMSNATNWSGAFIITWPIWAIAALIVIGRSTPAWRLPDLSTIAVQPVSRGVWALSTVAVLIWGPVLPFTQAEQHRRHEVEQALKSGRIAIGLQILNTSPRESFPPHWDLPPRIGYGEDQPPLFNVIRVLQEAPAPSWVRFSYVEKLDNYVARGRGMRGLDPGDMYTLLDVLVDWPEAAPLADRISDVFPGLIRRLIEPTPSMDARAHTASASTTSPGVSKRTLDVRSELRQLRERARTRGR